MDWTLYEPEGDDYVSVDRWGSDHWSTLAYAETRAVDHDGLIDNGKMRCDPRLHRHFAAEHHMQSSKKYPTRLRDGELEKHDDWSCLEDAAKAGLIVLSWHEDQRRARRGMVFGNCTAQVSFTDSGRRLAEQLRYHKAQGGTWAEFAPTLAERKSE